MKICISLESNSPDQLLKLVGRLLGPGLARPRADLLRRIEELKRKSEAEAAQKSVEALRSYLRDKDLRRVCATLNIASLLNVFKSLSGDWSMGWNGVWLGTFQSLFGPSPELVSMKRTCSHVCRMKEKKCTHC